MINYAPHETRLKRKFKFAQLNRMVWTHAHDYNWVLNLFQNEARYI